MLRLISNVRYVSLHRQTGLVSQTECSSFNCPWGSEISLFLKIRRHKHTKNCKVMKQSANPNSTLQVPHTEGFAVHPLVWVTNRPVALEYQRLNETNPQAKSRPIHSMVQMILSSLRSLSTLADTQRVIGQQWAAPASSCALFCKPWL